ncbi:hypothetical protein INT47_000830 [Mucor saturninus]|uniref:Uncharacterized protein n=1 Tax=Mucor saturninus TaxID=64648 RepID=A0A8H7RMK3_9FUNG|nr:hypothetical protein INT47_000830 [Mucor saturninus]
MGVTLSINNLISAVKSDQRDSYKPLCAKIVQSVRSMLVASDTISKDSLHIKTSGTLRCHHRAMMASLSKIILSSQLCADNTTDDVSKLLSDLHELLLAIRNFISTCENIPIQVHPVDPVLLTPETGASIHRRQSLDGGIRAKYQLQSDLIENLEAYGSSMQEQMEAFRMNLSRHSDSRCSLAVLLFTQYRNFGNQNGQFLSILEDIDFEGIQSPALTVAKQRLYDGLGLLFCKMQMMTDESIAMDTVTEDMQSAAKDIMEAIGSICKIMSSLVAAKTKQSLKSSSNSIIMKNHGKESTQISSFSDFLQKSATPDLSYKRSQSLSVESLNMTPINTHKQNRSSAPVTQNQPAVLSEEGKSPSTAKLKQFFGDDPLSTEGRVTKDEETVEEGGVPRKEPQKQQEGGPQQQQQQGEEESYLQYDYSPNEIVFTLDGSVKGGTLPALVERMTLHDYLDMNFNNTFLLTYRSFCTSMELLELLEARYNIKPPHGLSSQQLEIWTTKKQKLIRLRVFNVLKIWLEQYYYEEDSVILDRLLFFTNTSIKDTLSFSAYQLERLIQKRKEACKDLKKLIITQQVETPDPILPRNLKKFRLLDIDYIEMARQLTMMDFKMYSAIKPVECLNKAWSRDSNTAANIQASIDYCNQVTTWVSDEILTPSEVKKRSTLIKYWVNVAERCRLLNNFNTCMAILSAFDNSAVGRLKRTWEMVGARTNHLVSQIRKLMGANRNFNQYRVLIHSVNPPCIPFLGIYLQDLTFIEDGNPNFLKTSKDLINFAKRAKTAEVIREMQQYQTMGYQFRIVEEIQTFIMANLHSSRDEDQLYRESLKLEPKERDDEKITRLLQESGFL